MQLKKKQRDELEPWALVVELMEINEALKVADKRAKQAEEPGLYTVPSIDKVIKCANSLQARRSIIECRLDWYRDRGELAEKPVVPELKIKL